MFLAGEKARDVFVKSRLSVDQLGQIWSVISSDFLPRQCKLTFLLGLSRILKIEVLWIKLTSRLPCTSFKP